MKTPDRFEKMVERKRLAATYGLAQTRILRADDTVRLLRRQYAALRRLVVKQRARSQGSAFAAVLAKKRPDWYDAKIEVCTDLLAAMDHWKRGTK